MGDLISRDALQKDGIRAEYGYVNDDGLLLIPMRDVVKSIGNAPSVDAVKVVRCKDCKYHDVKFQGCGRLCMYVSDEFYCEHGEKK